MQWSRRFRLLDAMILVGATAVGFACARLGVTAVHSFYGFLNPDPRWLWYQTGATYSVAFLTIWSFTLLALATRGKPGELRGALRFPGTAACAISMFALICVLLTKVIWALSHKSIAFHPASWADVGSWGPRMGMAVAAAWLVLAACGRCQRPSDWLQWMGSGVGVGWIALGVVDTVFRNAIDV
jgi:hypothetical protein